MPDESGQQNQKEQIEALEKEFPVWISDIKTVDDAIDMIEKRFGGSDKSILLAGHNSSGVSLMKLLLKEEPEDKHGMAFDGLVHVNGHWVLVSKPYRAL